MIHFHNQYTYSNQGLWAQLSLYNLRYGPAFRIYPRPQSDRQQPHPHWWYLHQRRQRHPRQAHQRQPRSDWSSVRHQQTFPKSFFSSYRGPPRQQHGRGPPRHQRHGPPGHFSQGPPRQLHRHGPPWQPCHLRQQRQLYDHPRSQITPGYSPDVPLQPSGQPQPHSAFGFIVCSSSVRTQPPRCERNRFRF